MNRNEFTFTHSISITLQNKIINASTFIKTHIFITGTVHYSNGKAIFISNEYMYLFFLTKNVFIKHIQFAFRSETKNFQPILSFCYYRISLLFYVSFLMNASAEL